MIEAFNPFGKLKVPHSGCQICGEVVNAIGEDRFGHLHPRIHENSSFGFSSEYFPINPATICSYCQSKEPCYNGYTLANVPCQHPGLTISSYRSHQQSEDSLHRPRRSAEVVIQPIDDAALTETLQNKRASLEEYLKAHPCKGFKIHPAYFQDGDFISVYFENELPHSVDVADNVTLERSIKDERIVGVKLHNIQGLGLIHLDPDEIKFLIAEFDACAKYPLAEGTITASILKKLEKLKPVCNECGGGGYGQYGHPGDMPCRQCNS